MKNKHKKKNKENVFNCKMKYFLHNGVQKYVTAIYYSGPPNVNVGKGTQCLGSSSCQHPPQ